MKIFHLPAACPKQTCYFELQHALKFYLQREVIRTQFFIKDDRQEALIDYLFHLQGNGNDGIQKVMICRRIV